MLYLELLKEQLEVQRAEFKKFADLQSFDLDEYLGILDEIGSSTGDELLKILIDAENPGAIPSDELDIFETFSNEFETSWTNHEEARSWASEILQNRTIFAADGSQLYAEKETSLPVGAIQIGWFENPHNAGKVL